MNRGNGREPRRCKRVALHQDYVRLIPQQSLIHLEISARVEDAEAAAMSPVVVAETADRSVLGVLVDCAKNVPYYVGPARIDEIMMHFIESCLEDVLWYASKRREDVVFPTDKARELLEDRWGRG